MENIIRYARRGAGLTQLGLAQRSGTSRSTVAAYETGTKSPTLTTVGRLLAACGCGLTVTPLSARYRPVSVPKGPPRLAPEMALRQDRLPPHLEWSTPKVWDLSDRADRRRVYAIVLREGTARDIADWVDTDLLLDDWHEIALPAAVRREWEDSFVRWGLECLSPASSGG